ncbi:MAG: Oxysterol-binding protein [Amphiamblys sp. WSBS2006]|nr:MAG: Oxysterol-binding protein [Amphiamblys sp. WSBS2006]
MCEMKHTNSQGKTAETAHEDFFEEYEAMEEPEHDTKQRSVIISMLKQVISGTDLSKVTFPVFILEPRSLLEKITDFMAYPQLTLQTALKECHRERFMDVVSHYLSGWNIQPKRPLKPYNPILGEVFKCKWECPDGTTAYYVAEQVSHYPPVSCYFYSNPQSRLVIHGTFEPKSRLLGNSVVSITGGRARVLFLNRPDEEYLCTLPKIYARNVAVGTMYTEIEDTVKVRCAKTGMHAEIDFKTRRFFRGENNAVRGTIREAVLGEAALEVSGRWDREIYVARKSNIEKRSFMMKIFGKKEETGSLESLYPGAQAEKEPVSAETEKRVLFSAQEERRCEKIVRRVGEQEHNESRRLWMNVTMALRKKDYETATEEKARLEDAQRERIGSNEVTSEKYFTKGECGWQLRLFEGIEEMSPSEFEQKLRESVERSD